MSTEGEKSRGFSGISTMVSDVKDTVNEVNNEVQKPTETKWQGVGMSQTQESHAGGTVTFNQDNKKSGNGSKLKWILGIGAIIAIYMMFSGGSPTKQKPAPRQSAYTATAPTTKVAPPQTKPAELKIEVPPVGRDNILNLPQLRWYFREKIRIETMRDLPTTNRAIGEFNAMVDNYNSRCGSFRYKQSSFTQAQKDIDAIRYQIVADAKRDAKARGW